MTTIEQRVANLAAAEHARAGRELLRRDIGEGRVLASSALECFPSCIHGCGAYVFLSWIDTPQLAFVLLRRANCIQVGHKRLDQLTAGQLERLTRHVRDYETNRHPAERGMS